jgi:hypothetical protein
VLGFTPSGDDLTCRSEDTFSVARTKLTVSLPFAQSNLKTRVKFGHRLDQDGMIPSFPRRQALASILPRPLAMGEVAKLLAIEFMIVADHDVDPFFSSSVSRLTSDP